MSWAQQLADFMLNVFGSIFSFASKRLFLIFGLAIAATIVALFFTFYQNVVNEEFRLLTGPKGGSGERHGHIISRKFIENNQRKNPFGWGPSVDRQNTQGFEDNRAQVGADAGGRTFAFAHDGFGDASNIRVLLPIESNYLFIIGNRELLAENPFLVSRADETPDPQPAANTGQDKDCDEVAPEIRVWDKDKNFFQMAFAAAKRDRTPQATFNRKPKICLGPHKSGTWQVAHEVLHHFDIQPRDYARVDVDSWTQMKNALNRGEIDISFYLGRLDDETINDIIRSGSAFLIKLKHEDCDTITQTKPQISYASFKSTNLVPKSLVAWCNEMSNSCNTGTGSPADFCTAFEAAPENTYLLTTTRVLICSKQMSNSDAYKIASRVRFALSEEIPQFRWKEPLDDKELQNKQLSYALHPGAALLRDNKTPNAIWTILTKYWLVLLPLLLALIAGFAAAANRKWFEKPQPEEEEEGGAEEEVAKSEDESNYHALHEKIIEIEGRLDEAPYDLANTTYSNFHSEIRKLRAEVSDARNSDQITLEEYFKLKSGLRNLAIELSEFHTQKPKRRQTRSKQKTKA